MTVMFLLSRGSMLIVESYPKLEGTHSSMPFPRALSLSHRAELSTAPLLSQHQNQKCVICKHVNSKHTSVRPECLIKKMAEAEMCDLQ